MDLHAVSSTLAESIFDTGVLLVGDPEYVDDLQGRIVTDDVDSQSPRERFDAALARIDAHLDGDDDGVPASGGPERDR